MLQKVCIYIAITSCITPLLSSTSEAAAVKRNCHYQLYVKSNQGVIDSTKIPNGYIVTQGIVRGKGERRDIARRVAAAVAYKCFNPIPNQFYNNHACRKNFNINLRAQHDTKKKTYGRVKRLNLSYIYIAGAHTLCHTAYRIGKRRKFLIRDMDIYIKKIKGNNECNLFKTYKYEDKWFSTKFYKSKNKIAIYDKYLSLKYGAKPPISCNNGIAEGLFYDPTRVNF